MRLKKLFTQKFLSTGKCSCPLTSLVAGLLNLHKFISVFPQTGCNPQNYSSAVVAECRGKVTSLNLLAVLSIIQSRITLAFLAAMAPCYLLFSLSSAETPTPLSAELLPSQAVPTPSLRQGYFFLSCWTDN